MNRPIPISLLLALFAFAPGCGQESATPDTRTATAAETDPAAPAELGEGLSKIINDVSIRYAPLEYEYDEDLLDQLDRYESFFAAGEKGEPPRFMPKLDAAEEVAHFRETFRRWESKTGKTLRPEIDALKAEVAARKPGGPAFHPEFHRKFAGTFDDLIRIEVEEVRERRNRKLHDEAAPLLAKHRDEAPEAVAQYEATLNAPPYALPETSASESDAEGPSS